MSPFAHTKRGRQLDRRVPWVFHLLILFVFFCQAWCSVAGSQETPSDQDDSAGMERGFFVAKKDVENIQDRVFRERMRRFLAENGVITRNMRGSIYYYVAAEPIDRITDPEWKERVRRFVTDPLQEASAKTESEAYEIQPGDTLWEVATEHGMSVGEILHLNNLAPDQPIYPGQKIFVRPK